MPSMTSTRASAVNRSLIIRNGGGRLDLRRRRRAILRSLRARSAVAARAVGRWRRSWRSRQRCRRLEEAEETSLRCQDERGVAAVEGLAVGLQRAVEGKEFLVLAERAGIDPHRLR